MSYFCAGPNGTPQQPDDEDDTYGGNDDADDTNYSDDDYDSFGDYRSDSGDDQSSQLDYDDGDAWFNMLISGHSAQPNLKKNIANFLVSCKLIYILLNAML